MVTRPREQVAELADGRRHLRRKAEGTVERARELGDNLAEAMLADGAREILEETRSEAKGKY